MMRSISTVLFVVLFVFVGYGQMLNQSADFVIRGNYGKTILKNNLDAATILQDLNPGYPATWVNESGYISTQIKSTIDGKEVTSDGNNEVLTKAQRAVLSKLIVGANIEVEVKYNSTNVVTKKSDPQTMKFTVTLIPEIEATYVGGYEALTVYFQTNNIKTIKDELDQEEGLAVIRFVIDKDGRPIDINVENSSNNIQADQDLVDLIKAMDNWSPAQNVNGENVEQEFELVVGSMIGC